MRIIADLHLHSKYSRACSKDLTPENIDQWCRWKGINVVGTADFTHPTWFKELNQKLIESEPGLYRLKTDNDSTRFMVTTEISCIYKQGDKTRRLHICLFVPSLTTAKKIIRALEKHNCNLKSDGRPIIGLSAKNLAELVLDIDPNSLVIPAHAWTPWFSVFGSKSGFDSLEECFGELTPYIYAVETGLSSDPPMNWQWSALDHITLISNSDAHSPANLGREANVFDIDNSNFNYHEIRRIIKDKDKSKFLYTIEFFPEEGKYHFDGHAKCGYSAQPQTSIKQKNICPICKKPLLLGVAHRIEELSDKKNLNPADHIPYKSLIPLQEIIANVYQVGKNSKKVQATYFDIIKHYTEFEILIDLNEKQLNQISNPQITSSIINIRQGRVELEPGYDGVYGKIKIINDSIKPKQQSLL